MLNQKIFCLKHSIGFSIPKIDHEIICRVGFHALALSDLFIRGWQYCCNCYYFITLDNPNLNISSKNCPVCDRNILKRYLCNNCNLLSVESGTFELNKPYTILSKGLPIPGCPGCLSRPNEKLIKHDCKIIKSEIFTIKKHCPFCQKPTDINAKKQEEIVIKVSKQGLGDYTTIAEAIQNSKPGMKIHVLAGNYEESLEINKPIKLISKDPEQVVLHFTNKPCLRIKARNVEVVGFTIYSVNSKNTIEILEGNPLIQDCNIMPFSSLRAISVTGGKSNPTISKCQIKNAVEQGIVFENGAGGLMENCTIFNSGQNGVLISKNSDPTLKKCKILKSKMAGIYITDRGKGIIEGCEIYNNDAAGIAIDKKASPFIHECEVIYNADSAIWIGQNCNGTIEKCNLSGNREGAWKFLGEENESLISRRENITDNLAISSDNTQVSIKPNPITGEKQNIMKDIFLCHASEDKANVVRPLSQALIDANISCWLDEAEIYWGDSITKKINHGLANSRFVIVVLSEAFLSKNWPKYELNAMLNIEASSGEVKLLPLLVGSNQVLQKLPLLNDKLYLVWNNNSTPIVQALAQRLSITITPTTNSSISATSATSSTPVSSTQNNVSDQERAKLFSQLKGLVPGEFNQLLFIINPPSDLISPSSPEPIHRTSALLQWAESPTGCGLTRVQQVLQTLLLFSRSRS